MPPESSGLYSHITFKQSQISISPQLSDDSDPSLSDTASISSTHTPPPNIQTMTAKPIYKPKFHTVLQQCKTDAISQSDITFPEEAQQQVEAILYDQSSIETSDLLSDKIQECRHNDYKMLHELEVESRKRIRREDPESLVCNFHKTTESSPRCKNQQEKFPQAPPGPLLGSTRLIDQPKRARFESCLKSFDECKHQPRMDAVQMFGGEVRIVAASGETQTVRVQTRANQQQSNQKLGSSRSDNTLSSALTETASIVIRSGLQSGGTILRKQEQNQFILSDSLNTSRIPNSITPHIETPLFAPTLKGTYLKPTNILHAGCLIPFVPGIPGPQDLSPLSVEHNEYNTFSVASSKHSSVSQMQIMKTSGHSTISNKFFRPNTLPLKPGTFTPKCHHGITPTANTLVLISPETPRPKKSYGQLHLNGHAYTYLGLKCSTRLFYCTLNKPQPMYVLQQRGISMYSNWKVCQETSPELELQYYDSRNRPYSYTLANTYYQDILTHSSQRSTTPTSPDSGLESDCHDKAKRVRIFDGGFESNEEYTYIRGRGMSILFTIQL